MEQAAPVPPRRAPGCPLANLQMCYEQEAAEASRRVGVTCSTSSPGRGPVVLGQGILP